MGERVTTDKRKRTKASAPDKRASARPAFDEAVLLDLLEAGPAKRSTFAQHTAYWQRIQDTEPTLRQAFAVCRAVMRAARDGDLAGRRLVKQLHSAMMRAMESEGANYPHRVALLEAIDARSAEKVYQLVREYMDIEAAIVQVREHLDDDFTARCCKLPEHLKHVDWRALCADIAFSGQPRPKPGTVFVPGSSVARLACWGLLDDVIEAELEKYKPADKSKGSDRRGGGDSHGPETVAATLSHLFAMFGDAGRSKDKALECFRNAKKNAE